MEDFSFDKIKFMIDGLEKIKIYPFSWRNGVINLTENGYVKSSASSSNYSFMQKYFTGKDVLTITWDNSTKITVWDKRKGQFKYNFKVGKYYEAVEIPPTSNTLEIGKNDAHEEFINMTGNFEATFAIYNVFPTEDDLYKPYIILSETGRKVLFLTNYLTTRNPNNKNECITVATFISSKDKLMTSGRAIEQFIQFAAPGEPYAFPEEQPDGTVKISQDIGQNPTGVKYIQIEHQGGAAYCGTLITGRRIWRDETTGFWISSPSMFLLPRRFVNTQTNPLNKTGATSKEYYFFNNETLETRTDQNFQEANKNLDSALAPLKNEGVFTMGLNNEWNEPGSEGVHKSNKLSNDGRHTSFMDLNWKPNWAEISRESNGCLYTTDENVLSTNDSMIQILIKNMFLYSTQLELPLDFTDSKPYRWSTLHILGSLIQRFYGDKAMFSTTKSKKTISLAYFINCSVAQASTKYFSQPADDTARWYGTLSTWLGEGAPKGLPVQGISTCFAYELTDMVSFTDPKDDTKTIETSTINFGQEKDENGNWFYDDHTPLIFNTRANSNITPKKVKYSFVIDQIENFSLFNGKIKISCFGEYNNSGMTNPVFTQTVLSSSKFESENVRNWCTEITSGCWSDEYVEGDIEWPINPYKDAQYVLPVKSYGKSFLIDTGIVGSTNLYMPDHDDLPFNIYKVYSRSEDEKATAVTHTKNIWNNEVDYSDIGPYETREAAMNALDHFNIVVSGSRLTAQTYDELHYPSTYYDASINEGSLSIPISEFEYDEENDEYVFEKQLGIGAFNCSIDNPIKNVTMRSGPYDNYILYGKNTGALGIRTYNGGWSQVCKIKIIMKVDTIQFIFDDNTVYYGYRDDDSQHDWFSIVYKVLQAGSSYGRHEQGIDLRSCIYIDSIQMIEK